MVVEVLYRQQEYISISMMMGKEYVDMLEKHNISGYCGAIIGGLIGGCKIF